VPKDLDDKASRLTKKEGIPDSAIIRKAVARYVQATGKSSRQPPHQDARAPPEPMNDGSGGALRSCGHAVGCA